MAELHSRLAAAARSCYPSAARRFALKGAVRLKFALDPSGAATSSALEGSTGSPLLDRAALQCVLPRAAPLPALPGNYTVEVRFDAE
ncbi:MAG: TonB family protein [Myxococcaceae bacterium]